MYSRLLVLCHLLNSVSLGAIVILHPGWLKDPCSFLHIHCLLTLKLLASDESIVSRAHTWRAPPLQPISHHTATQVFCTTSFPCPISQDSLLSPLHVVSLLPGVPLPRFSPGNEAPSHSGKHHLLWDLLTSKNKKRTLLQCSGNTLHICHRMYHTMIITYQSFLLYWDNLTCRIMSFIFLFLCLTEVLECSRHSVMLVE